MLFPNKLHNPCYIQPLRSLSAVVRRNEIHHDDAYKNKDNHSLVLNNITVQY